MLRTWKYGVRLTWRSTLTRTTRLNTNSAAAAGACSRQKVDQGGGNGAGLFAARSGGGGGGARRRRRARERLLIEDLEGARAHDAAPRPLMTVKTAPARPMVCTTGAPA